MDIGEIVKTGVKVAGLLGTVGAAVGGAREVAKLGEATGINPVGILKSAGNFAADVAGLPPAARFGAPPAPPAATAADSPRMLGAATEAAPVVAAPVVAAPAEAAATPPLLVVCPECQSGMRIEGGAGQSIALMQCDKHRDAALSVSTQVEGMYLGWVDAYAPELGASPESKCASMKPDKTKFITALGFQAMAYQAALIMYQKCVADTRAAADEAAKAKAENQAAIDAAKKAQKSHDLKAQERATKFLLANQAKAYEKQIADREAAQATKATAENQAAIDALQAQKATAEKALADMQSTQRDSALQAKLDALQAQVVSAGTKPGGVDELLKMMLMQQMMPKPVAQQTAPEQAMMAAQQQPAMSVPWAQQSATEQAYFAAQQQPIMAAPWGQQATDQAYFAEQSMSPMYQDPGYAYEFMGTDAAKSDAEQFNDATPLDPGVADALDISGVSTVGDANMLVGLRIAGWDIGELLDGWDGESRPASNCSVGSCGIQR